MHQNGSPQTRELTALPYLLAGFKMAYFQGPYFKVERRRGERRAPK